MQLQLTFTTQVSPRLPLCRAMEIRSSQIDRPACLGGGEANIVEEHGLTKTIEVIPLQVGTVQLSVLVSFSDG